MTNNRRHRRFTHRAAVVVSGLTLAIATSILPTFFPPALRGLTSAYADDFNPPDRGLPGGRQGGGSRGPCLTSDGNLVAIVPESTLGLTIADYPQIFWYLPEHRPSYMELRFYSTNADFQDQELLFSTQFKTNGQPGIQQLEVPDSISFEPLQEGATYHWYISLVCDPDDPAQNITVSGWLERVPVSSDLELALNLQDDLERSKALAQAGIWFDTLDTLAELQCSASEPEVDAYWHKLLDDDQVNLVNLKDSPWLVCP